MVLYELYKYPRIVARLLSVADICIGLFIDRQDLINEVKFEGIAKQIAALEILARIA